MAASNCGQILQEREDPFDLKVILQIHKKKKKKSIIYLFRKLTMISIKMLIKCYL